MTYEYDGKMYEFYYYGKPWTREWFVNSKGMVVQMPVNGYPPEGDRMIVVPISTEDFKS